MCPRCVQRGPERCESGRIGLTAKGPLTLVPCGKSLKIRDFCSTRSDHFGLNWGNWPTIWPTWVLYIELESTVVSPRARRKSHDIDSVCDFEMVDQQFR